MIQLPITIEHLDRIASALERLVLLASASRFTYTIQIFEVTMPIFKADRVDFDITLTISATDSEGNVIADAPIPTGHTLTITSDNAAAFTATQDAANLKLAHCHVGSPGQANVTANLTDPAGNLVATGADQVTVTFGDPSVILAINLNLPAE